MTMRNTIHVNDHRLISRSDLAVIADMIPHGAKILDLGCGFGWHASYFMQHGAES